MLNVQGERHGMHEYSAGERKASNTLFRPAMISDEPIFALVCGRNLVEIQPLPSTSTQPYFNAKRFVQQPGRLLT